MMMKRKRVTCAGIGAMLLAQSLITPLASFAGETAQDMVVPKWTFTQNAGNLPEDPGNPDDDLNLYANYTYLSENQDTMDQSSLMDDGMEEASEKQKNLLENFDIKGHAADQLKLFYEQAKDMKTRDEQGISEIQPLLDKILKSDTIEGLNSVLTSEEFPFEVLIRAMIGSTDLRETSAVIILPRFLSADSLEGSRYMMDGIDSTESIMNALEELEVRLQAMTALSRLGGNQLTYNELARFEKQYGKLAYNSTYQSKTEGLDPKEWKTLNYQCTFDDLKELCSNFPLAEMIANEGRGGAQTYSIPCPEWIRKLDELWNEENLEILKTIAAVQVLTECAPYLDSAFQVCDLETDETETAATDETKGISWNADSALMVSELCYLLDNFTVEELVAAVMPLFTGYFGETGDLIAEPILKLAVKLDSLGTEESIANLLKNEMVASFVSEIVKNLPDILQMISMTSVNEATQPNQTTKKENGNNTEQAFVCCNSPETFSQLLSELYLEECVDEQAKERLIGLTDDLIEAYRELIGQTEWLEEESRTEMLSKLDNMRLNVLEPEGGYLSFEDLELTKTEDGGTLLGNYLTVKQYVRDQQNLRIGQPASSNMCWDYFSPLIFNCFYDTDSNSINILPGFIASCTYDDDFSEEQLLGGMGYVIAHEISHAFDYSGCHYNAYGAMEDCLTQEDQDEYERILARLSGYYSAIELDNGDHEDGEKIICEAGADLCAVGAVEACAKTKEDFDFKSMYYRMAEFWASVCVRGFYKMMLVYDTHPLDCLRTNVNVQMYDSFYEAFHIDEEDGMYLPEEQRIRIWGY